MSDRLVPHRFSVTQYDRMIDVGILKEDDRVELIRGVILTKWAVSDRHIACVDRLCWKFVKKLGDSAIVSIQNPIRLADTEPEPDVVLKKARKDYYGKPGPADILLVIEVADASLENDREVKGPLYAENGIVEYWIVNLVDNCLEVHRQPRPDGTFADIRTLWAGETIDIAAISGMTIAVGELIGK